MRNRKSRCAFNKICVSYHSALKKILVVRKYFSKYLVCFIFQTFTFEHFFKCKNDLFYVLTQKVLYSVFFVPFQF